MKYLTDGKRHLICLPYSVSNLHVMAEKLNIKRCWYHGGKYPHYDIPKERTQEILDICEKVSSRDIIEIIKFAKYLTKPTLENYEKIYGKQKILLRKEQGTTGEPSQ